MAKLINEQSLEKVYESGAYFCGDAIANNIIIYGINKHEQLNLGSQRRFSSRRNTIKWS